MPRVSRFLGRALDPSIDPDHELTESAPIARLPFMHIELIDTLRCPNPHSETWLVGAFDRVIERDIVAGRLGCPECGATYGIIDGIVDFDLPVPLAVRDGTAPMTDSDSENPPRDTHDEATLDADAALRIAAMLDLASPGGLVILEGAWALAGPMLATFVDARLLIMNPPLALGAGHRLSGVRSRRSVPVAAGSCRGIALHRTADAGNLVNAAAAALRPGGRLVAPAGVPVPGETRELARDDAWWVAERVPPPPSLVRIGRG